MSRIVKRISIPEDCSDILEWFENQLNSSTSVLILLRRHIAQYGTGDVLSMIDLFASGSKPAKSRTRKKAPTLDPLPAPEPERPSQAKPEPSVSKAAQSAPVQEQNSKPSFDGDDLLSSLL